MNTRNRSEPTRRQVLALLLSGGFFFALVVAVAQSESVQVAAAVSGVGLLMLIATALLCARDVRRARAPARWPCTFGTLLRAWVDHTEDSDGDDFYFPAVEYTYTVDADSYTGRAIARFDVGYKRRTEAEAAIFGYVPHAVVPVYYDPGRPDVAVLRVESASRPVRGWVFLGMWLLPSLIGGGPAIFFLLSGGLFVVLSTFWPGEQIAFGKAWRSAGYYRRAGGPAARSNSARVEWILIAVSGAGLLAVVGACTYRPGPYEYQTVKGPTDDALLLSQGWEVWRDGEQYQCRDGSGQVVESRQYFADQERRRVAFLQSEQDARHVCEVQVTLREYRRARERGW